MRRESQPRKGGRSGGAMLETTFSGATIFTPVTTAQADMTLAEPHAT